jgi:hypothetical protein
MFMTNHSREQFAVEQAAAGISVMALPVARNSVRRLTWPLRCQSPASVTLLSLR